MVSIKTVGNQTQQPVRFYKFVALTFLIITVLLLGMIVFMSSKRANITVITRATSVDVKTQVDINGNKNIVPGFVTSTFVNIEKLFSPQGSKIEDGISEGMVTIFNDTDFDQPLVATTRLLTPEGILFRMKNREVVPANGSVVTEVYADQKGATGDIGSRNFSIPGLRAEKQKVVYAKSDDPMSGGVRTVGILTTEDIEKAQQIVLSDLKKKGVNKLEQMNDTSSDGVLYEVAQYTFEYDEELGVETDGFVLSGKATIVGISYDNGALFDYAQKMLEKQVVDNSEILQSVESEPVVVIEDYDLSENTATVGITYSGLVNLDSNSKELQKLIFFGKTEDEVRRYVMSLDHVQGVEMSFKPLWNRSVPHVASRVKITVREVE